MKKITDLTPLERRLEGDGHVIGLGENGLETFIYVKLSPEHIDFLKPVIREEKIMYEGNPYYISPFPVNPRTAPSPIILFVPHQLLGLRSLNIQSRSSALLKPSLEANILIALSASPISIADCSLKSFF